MLRRRITNNFGVNARYCATWRLQASTFSHLLFSSMPTFDLIDTMHSRHSTNHITSMMNLNSNNIMLTPRRIYHCRQLDTAVTVQRKDGKTYPALLSWNWNTQRPRHLVVKIAEPASTFRNAPISNKKEESTSQTSENVESSANRSSDNQGMSIENRCNEGFTSESEYNSSSASLPASSMTSDAQSANAQSDDPYFFGRLFLRVQNVAELLSVLIGWSSSAQIERERAGLMLRPTSFASQENNANGRMSSAEGKEIGDGKNDMVVGKTCEQYEKLYPLSNFTLTGYFTKKMKVDESNEKYIEQEEIAKQRNYAIHGRDENEEKSVYIDNELCTVSVTLQASELMILKNFLDNTMSNIFGIEHSYYRKVTEQALEKQRRFLARRSYNNINNNSREAITSYLPRYRSEMIDRSPHNRSTPTQQNMHMAASMPRRNYPEELQQQLYHHQQKKEQYLYEEEQMQRGGGVGGSHYDGVAQVKEDYTRPFIINDKSSRAITNDKSSMANKNEGNDNQNTLQEKLAPVRDAHVFTPVTEATADLTSELQNEENVDDLDHEMQQDDIDDSKSISAEIDNICDEEYEEIDEHGGMDGEDDAGNDSQTITNKNSSTDNSVKSNTADASDDSAHKINRNCEVIADEESVRDTDELDAEEVDADEEIEIDELARDDQEKTVSVNGNDDDEVNEKDWEVSEEEEEVIDEDVADDAADKDQGEEEVVVEEEEVVEEEVEEEEEIGVADQTKMNNHNTEVTLGTKDKMCMTDKLDSVDKHKAKETAIDSQLSEEVDDEQNELKGEQVHHERNTYAGNDTQSALEQSDMWKEEIEEIIEEEIEEVEDEADDVDDEHVKTLATSETGNVAAEMNVDAQNNKSVNTSQTNTDSMKKIAHDDSMVEDVKITADNNNVSATDTFLPDVNKSASVNVQMNKHKTREHATQTSESDNNEPVMEVKTNAARTLATKVANIREQGASEVSADEDISNNSEQSTKPEVHHKDEKVVMDSNKLISKHDKAAKKINKTHIVVPSSTKRSAKKSGHASHTKKSSKKSKKKSKGDQRIIV